jgi:hypothetical protein
MDVHVEGDELAGVDTCVHRIWTSQRMTRGEAGVA